MTSKIRIKLGTLEVDYEGTDDFITNQLLTVLKTLQEFHPVQGEGGDDNEKDTDKVSKQNAGQLTTNTIAQKLAAKTGSELIRAAAARLGIVLNKATFTRKELHEECKSATSYYNKSVTNNFDKYIKTLLNDGTLLLQGEGTYAIAAVKATEIEAILVQS